jgi:hypothetical protein
VHGMGYMEEDVNGWKGEEGKDTNLSIQLQT